MESMYRRLVCTTCVYKHANERKTSYFFHDFPVKISRSLKYGLNFMALHFISRVILNYDKSKLKRKPKILRKHDRPTNRPIGRWDEITKRDVILESWPVNHWILNNFLMNFNVFSEFAFVLARFALKFCRSFPSNFIWCRLSASNDHVCKNIHILLHGW